MTDATTPDLPTILRKTTEQMASACSAPMELWCDHSNAVLAVADEIERLRAALREIARLDHTNHNWAPGMATRALGGHYEHSSFV